jgi:hypothetical protein
MLLTLPLLLLLFIKTHSMREESDFMDDIDMLIEQDYKKYQ